VTVQLTPGFLFSSIQKNKMLGFTPKILLNHGDTRSIELARQQCLARLKIKDDDPDALYFLGMAESYQANYAQAISVFERLLEAGYESDELFLNLSIAYMNAGYMEKSEGILVHIIDSKPASSLVKYGLGMLCQRREEYEQALDYFKAVPLHDVNSYLALTGSGDACRKLGQFTQAIKLYRSALAQRPDYLRAVNHLGLLLLAMGFSREALEYCQQAVAMDPEVANNHLYLGQCLWSLDCLDEAMDAYASAFECDPESVPIAVQIGQSFQELTELQHAEFWYKKALSKEPENLEGRIGLAQLCGEREEPNQGIKLLLPLTQEDGISVTSLKVLARLHWDEGNIDEACEVLNRALIQEPENVSLHHLMGALLSSSGDMGSAEAHFRRALKLNPKYIPALSGLAVKLKSNTDSAIIDSINAILQRDDLTERARASLHNGLTYFFDGKGDAVNAAKHLSAANQLNWSFRSKRGWSYSREAHQAFVDNLISYFDGVYFDSMNDKPGSYSEIPVFVVGMPRSGTTLTEQILSSHSSVLGVGERPYLGRSFHAAQALSIEKHEDEFSIFENMQKNVIKGIADEYLQQLEYLKEFNGHETAIRVVDKMPDNYQFIGWLITLFPNARIIYCNREVRDIGLSCWMTQFRSIRWANDLENIAHRLLQHKRLMKHWEQVLPGKIYTVNYEHLVKDQEAESRKLIENLGLEWEEQCLEFFNSKRLVRTASVDQVRKPIYTSSLNRWEPYKKVLQPMLEILDKHGL